MKADSLPLLITSLILLLASSLGAASATAPMDTVQPQAPVTAQSPRDPAATTDTLQTELLGLVNAQRQQAGSPSLRLNHQLNQAAQRHARDLATEGSLSHTGSDGSTMQTRIEATGYRWTAIGENIARGQRNPEAVMDSWMNSQGHRSNILNPAFSELGLGYAEADGQQYWVQVFASPR